VSPSPDLRARVLAAAAAAPSATRAQARRRAGALFAIGALIALVVFDGGRAFSHGAGRPPSITAALTAGWALASALLTFVALGRGTSTLSRRPAILLGLALAAPIALFAWMQVFHGSYVEPFERFGFRCFGYTVALAAAPLAAVFVLRRGAEPRLPAALGAAAGATSGAWAAALVDVWCPLVNPSHVFFGHALPLALLVAVGAFAGARLLGVRRAR
jgi:hypothetical protein